MLTRRLPMIVALAIAITIPMSGAAADATTGPLDVGSTALLTHDGTVLVPVTIAFCLPANEVENLSVALNQPTHNGAFSGGTASLSTTDPPCVDGVQHLTLAVSGSFKKGSATVDFSAQFCQLDVTFGIPCGSPPDVIADIEIVKDRSKKHA